MSTETEAVQDLVLAAENAKQQPFILNGPNDRQFIARPDDAGGWVTEEIQPRPNELAPFLPKHVTQAVQLQNTASLVEYINRFKNSDSALFADIAANDILGIIDYHKAPAGEGAEARLTKHTAKLHIPFSLEWQTWTGIDGRLMSHVDFATFLEENAMDIMELPPARDASGSPIEDAPTTLLELCRELQVKSSYGANSAVRSGDYTNVEFQKGDDISTKRNVALPLSIKIMIPVYFGEPAVILTAFMRRKVDDGNLKLGVKLQRPENARQDEFHRIVSDVTGNVGLTTLYGKPA